MKDIIEDLFKIYISCIDSYNSKIHQIVNDKYTIIDKSMIAVYLFVKIIEDRNEKNQVVIDTLSNNLLKQIIYGETGSLAFEISESDFELYYNILDKLVLEKFQYKNRIMKKLQYSYKNIEENEYNKLLIFLEDIAEFAIFQKMILRGNQEVISYCNNIKNKIVSKFENNNKDYFYEEKKIIVDSIITNTFNKTQYGNLINIVLNLKEVYRYSNIPTQLPENVLLHSYTTTIISFLFAEYCNKELGEKIDIYTIIIKSLFHDFGEYKGTEIITHFKNYNDVTKKMFAEIEAKDEKDLEELIGTNLYVIISEYKYGVEGYISEMIDKMLGIMKLWVEVGYFNNYTFIKTINSIYQDRFKRFLRINDIDEIQNKYFYLELLREYYIYIKEHLMEKDLDYFFKYFTKEELEMFRKEIKLLKNNPETFLK